LGIGNARGDEIAHLPRHVAHKRLENRFLTVEIDVEAARGDAARAVIWLMAAS
jgi:hypothetical protein